MTGVCLWGAVGQGIFSPFLVPGGIRARAQQLPASTWQAVGKDTYLHGRGAEYNCSNGTTSIKCTVAADSTTYFGHKQLPPAAKVMVVIAILLQL